MNPHEEQELHREEGENLLEQLTRLTEEDKLVWTCARYIPLLLFREADDPVELAQLSQDYICDTKHGDDLMDYEALAEKSAAASARFRKLSAEIKDAEKRMAEIAVLRTHVLNYVKTRDTYAAYRKAGYSKKFLAAHEGDILLHKAAKKYFEEQGMTKLPTIKRLNTEYAELLAKKKAAYGEYRQAREDMQELVTAKANIDRILGKEAPEHEASKEKTEQR